MAIFILAQTVLNLPRFRWHRIIRPIVSDAAAPVTDLLAGYERYAEANWDCCGAEPITPETVEAAGQFLGMLPDALGKPHISPGSDGTIGLEWVLADGPLRKLYIDVGPGRVWGVIGAEHPGSGAPTCRSPSTGGPKRSLPICSKI